MNKWMLVLLLLLFPLNLSAFPYVCIIEDSVGFSQNKKTKKWENKKFTDREKYLVSKSKNQKFIAEVKEFGKSERLLYCGSLADDVKEANTYLFGFGALRCQSEEGGHYNAYINVEYLKIIVSSHGGYGVLGNNNSPFLGIGSCFSL